MMQILHTKRKLRKQRNKKRIKARQGEFEFIYNNTEILTLALEKGKNR